MKLRLLIAGILASLVCFSQTHLQRTYFQDQALEPREQLVDFEHLTLDVSFDPKQKLVNGTVVHTFKVLRKQLDHVILDAPGIEIKEAQLDNNKVQFVNEGKTVRFNFDKPLEKGSKHDLTLVYQTHPKKGIYFVGWDDTTGRSRKQIWTQGQGIDNRHWIPMYDSPNDKITTDIKVTFESGYKVLSNGVKLAENKNKDGNTFWHFRMKKPHATYLIMLGIGNYEIITKKSSSGVPMHFWYYPEWKNRVASTFKYSLDMMDFMERETGFSYPWNTYSQIPVQDYMYGAMENTTATVFGDFYCTDERSFHDKNYVRVNAHELAHQWFGDCITARTSSHHWLQESFATHYDLSYQGVAFGKDHFDWERRKATIQSINQSKSDLKPIAHSQAGSVRHYPKGAYVLQMLKYVVGKEQFNNAVNYYLTKHAYQNVHSDDFLLAFFDSQGISLNWFWEDWIYRGGEPHYSVDFNTESNNDMATFHVRQIHKKNEWVDNFKMPIYFEIHYDDGTKTREKSWIENDYHAVNVKVEKGKNISYVLFDPGSQVMKSVTFDKSFRMLTSQSTKAEHMLDRYDAVNAMNSIALDQKREVLQQIISSEDFYAVRAEALKQLYGDPASADLLRSALTDQDVNMRKESLKMLNRIPPTLKTDCIELLQDSSYEMVTSVLHKLCMSFPKETVTFLDQTKDVHGTYKKNVRLKWLEMANLYERNPENLNELVDYTSPSFEFGTRVEAARTLQRLNYMNEEMIANIIHGINSFNSRLRNPMKKVLKHFHGQTMYRTMIVNYIESQSWTDLERRRLSSYSKL